MSTARAECLCGEVKLEVTLPVKWCAHCHCSMCRRAHAAAFVTWIGVDTAAFSIASGEGSLARYASSEEARRGFCKKCGSTLLFESERWAGEVHVALAAFVDPIDKEPQAHAFWDDRVTWVHLEDDLKRMGGETGTEPIN